MSSVKRSVVSLNKNGEMRLKNKVGVAITRDNCYEERALNSKLQEIDKYKDKTGRYLDGRKADFARKNTKNSESERPNTIDTSEVASMLPPIQHRTSKRRSQSVPTEQLESIKEKRNELPKIENMQLCEETDEISPPRGKRRRKNHKNKRSTTNNESVFMTENGPKNAQPSRENTFLPQIGLQSRQEGIEEEVRATRKDKGVNLPKLLEVSRQKSLLDSKDPRFQRLETCLVQCPPDCEHTKNLRI